MGCICKNFLVQRRQSSRGVSGKGQCEAWGLAEPTWRGLGHLQVSLAFFYISSGPLSPEQQLVGSVCLDTVSVRVLWSNRTYRMHRFLSLSVYKRDLLV